MAENRLARETSPYLLQHKDNPVDWRPWGAEALDAARQADKPILLSVGYAACHWCHVMAHESFENPDIAALMNQHFVNIKVDREERPDIDAIYMNALHLMGEHGGWPLTMFLTPDGEPFWGGTYFPPEPRWGRPSFPQVLRSIAAAYRDKREDVAKNVAALREGLQQARAPESDGAQGDMSGIPAELFDRIAERLLREVDPLNGGIGTAPKFPQSGIFELLWRAWKRTRQPPYKDAVTRTLTTIGQGGIYDHLGGGWARYSVDARWLVPHFEKMLYDNAELIGLMSLVWQETRDPLYATRVAETVGWLEREMTHPRGRLLQQPRRRQRGRGGEILRLVRGRDRCGARRRARGAVQAVLRRDPRRQLGGEEHPEPPRASGPCRRRDRGRAGALPRDVASGPRRRACAPVSTTRSWRTGTG